MRARQAGRAQPARGDDRGASPATADATGFISHVMRFALHDGPGIRTTVFLKGCPLACWWCHNPETQESRPTLMYSAERCRRCLACVDACPAGALAWVDGAPVVGPECSLCGDCADACVSEARVLVGRRCSAGEVLDEVERDVPFFDESGGGITISGGEPLSQPRFLGALLAGARERGMHTVLQTCGHAPQDVAVRLCSLADLVLYDLKLMDAAAHERYTGVSNEQILSNLGALAESGVPLVVRIPVIPGINDTEQEQRLLRAFVERHAVRAVELLPYHAAGTAKYRRIGWDYRLESLAAPAAGRMQELAERFRGATTSIAIGGRS
jgi:pyruvate formate lyase activating enzyme